MLRSFTFAALLLLTLLWASTAWAEPPSSDAPAAFQTHVETEVEITSATAVTGGNVITVTTTLDEVNSDGDCSLREAVRAADTDGTVDGCVAGDGGDMVTLPPGTYVLTQGQLELTGMITLQGSITGTTILDGNGQERVLYIHPGAAVELFYLGITNSHIDGGTGLANYGRTLIANSMIHGNSAGEYSGVHGAGIYNEGTLTLINSTVSDNAAGGSLCVAGDRFCESNGNGGGIYNRGTLDVINSTISGNAAGYTTCIPLHGVTPRCPPNGRGGGIYNLGTLILENSTVIDGDVYNQSSPSMFKNRNNIIADCGGFFTSLGNNLIQDISDCIIIGDFIHWAVHLEPLDDNGGPTLTRALNRTSPAIDAGECTDSAGITVTVDQRGEPRPQGDGCDIGAYESPYTSTFTITDTNLPWINNVDQ